MNRVEVDGTKGQSRARAVARLERGGTPSRRDAIGRENVAIRARGDVFVAGASDARLRARVALAVTRRVRRASVRHTRTLTEIVV